MSGWMGTLEGLMGSAPGGASSQQAGGLLGSALGSVGGVQGLLGLAQQAGLGSKVQSWMGSGSNAPISADEVGKIFTPDQIEGFAQQHGVPSSMVAPLLAHLLPHAVDNATSPDSAGSGRTSDEAQSSDAVQPDEDPFAGAGR